MRTILAMAMVMCLASSLILSPAYAADVEKVTKEVQIDLQKQGLSAEDAAELKEPVKEMLANGASKDDIVKPLVELSKNEVKGNDLKNSAESMNELVKSGATPKEAGNVVSQAAHQAQAEGIKGKALAAKVHEAVKTMQAEKRAAHAEKKAAKEMKEKEKEVKKAEEQGKAKREEAEKHGKGMQHKAGKQGKGK
jgi:hypothetical protein